MPLDELSKRMNRTREYYLKLGDMITDIEKLSIKTETALAKSDDGEILACLYELKANNDRLIRGLDNAFSTTLDSWPKVKYHAHAALSEILEKMES